MVYSVHIVLSYPLSQHFGPLAVEASFPSAARIILWDNDAASFRRGLEDLESGSIFIREGNAVSLVTGSRAEGMAMEWQWGTKDTDTDFMLLRGGGWGVYIDDGDATDVKNRLVLDVSQSSPAYGRLRVEGNLEQLAERMGKATVGPVIAPIGPEAASTCFVERYGQCWLSSKKCTLSLRQGKFGLDNEMCGPAQSYNVGFELINGFVCSGPLPELRAFVDRVRESEWPSAEFLERISRQPAILVAVGHHLSKDADIEFRLSWSFVEILLCQSLPEWVKQGYRAFKYVVKAALSQARLADEQRAGTGWEARGQTEGRSVLGSYHLKTTLFWTMEEASVWKHHCPYRLFLLLLDRFEVIITPSENNTDVAERYKASIASQVKPGQQIRGPEERPRQPHYLLPSCDLLQCVSDAELRRGRQCISDIRSDPIAALLHAPFDPCCLYGGPTATGYTDWDASERRRRLLTTALRTNPATGTEEFVRHQAAVRSLLRRLDDYRSEHHKSQLRRDKESTPRSSGRPDHIRSLLEMWEEVTSTVDEINTDANSHWNGKVVRLTGAPFIYIDQPPFNSPLLFCLKH